MKDVTDNAVLFLKFVKNSQNLEATLESFKGQIQRGEYKQMQNWLKTVGIEMILPQEASYLTSAPVPMPSPMQPILNDQTLVGGNHWLTIK